MNQLGWGSEDGAISRRGMLGKLMAAGAGGLLLPELAHAQDPAAADYPFANEFFVKAGPYKTLAASTAKVFGPNVLAVVEYWPQKSAYVSYRVNMTYGGSFDYTVTGIEMVAGKDKFVAASLLFSNAYPKFTLSASAITLSMANAYPGFDAETESESSLMINSFNTYFITGETLACFLTTACTAARGLPDDCWDLTALRRFRDDVLLSTPAGRALVDDYYRIAPGIVRQVNLRHDSELVWNDVYARLVRPTLGHLAQGRNLDAIEHYRRETLRLAEFLG